MLALHGMREPAREIRTSGNETMTSLLAGKGDIGEVDIADLGVSIPFTTFLSDEFLISNMDYITYNMELIASLSSAELSLLMHMVSHQR